MIKILLIFVLILINNPIFSQKKNDNSKTEKSEEGTCPAPEVNDFLAICVDIGSKAKVPSNEQDYYEYTYEKRLFKISCANPITDSDIHAKEKIQKMWNIYKKNFKCNTVGFNLQNGNILKFSIAQNMPDVVETFASSYGLDINFVDPVDNKNVLDYVDSEIMRFSNISNGQDLVKIYKEYRSTLIDMGAKPSH